jgi:hypothetical protein
LYLWRKHLGAIAIERAGREISPPPPTIESIKPVRRPIKLNKK